MISFSGVIKGISFQNEGLRERYFPFENSPSLVAGTAYGIQLINNEAKQIIDLYLHTENRLAGRNMFVKTTILLINIYFTTFLHY